MLLPPEYPTEYPTITDRFSLEKSPIDHSNDASQPCTKFYLVPPPTRLSNTKCHFSLYYSPPCFSSLALRLPGLLPRAVSHRWNGYASCRIHYASLCRYLMILICWRHVQTFNSFGQDPCVVAAFLLSTCGGGCQYYYLLCLSFGLFPSTKFADSSLFQRLPSFPYRRVTRTGGQVVLTAPICASATPSYTPSSVHAMHARERSGLRTIATDLFFQIPGPYLPLAGRNMHTTAQESRPPGREFPFATESYRI